MEKDTRIDVKEPKQLLVEGKDQQNFFQAFVRHLSLPHIQVQDFKGVTQLRDMLLGIVSNTDFDSVTSLGIVRDAERSAPSAFQSVQDSIKNINNNIDDVNLAVPTKAGERESGNPSVSVLVLPDESSPGMLETLICRTFEGSEVDRCIDDFFACAAASPNVSINNPDKARAFAFLTTKPNPHHSVGIAAHQGIWNLNHEAFEGVRDFLQAL